MKALRGGRWWVRQANAYGQQVAAQRHAEAKADLYDADGIGGDSGTGRQATAHANRPTSADPIDAERAAAAVILGEVRS